MKLCTNIEQSKKLIELGIDVNTADMGWNVFVDDTIRLLPIDDWDLVKDGSGNVKFYPAWSLSALIDVLPRVDIEKEMWSDDTYEYRVKAYIGDGYVGDWFDNPIDACYDMIIELHKDKLL